jgi:histidine kinase
MRQFARKSDLDLEAVQLNEVIEKAFEIFSQQLKVRGIRLDWRPGVNLPTIMADPARLEQVIINLLVNARDAIEEKWEREGRKREDDRITIRTKSDKKTISIDMQDTGTGIPEAIRKKCFEPFFTTKSVGKGTGLGLSISYGIVRKCGGTIEARPNKDQGAHFIVTFPINEAAQNSKPQYP